MICYKDRTYCSDAPVCANKDCDYILIDEDIQDAKKLNLWISLTSFKSSCPSFEPVGNT